MNILVTGGTGVIGAAAIPALIRAGHKVRLLSRHAARDVQDFPDGVEPIEADIASPDGLGDAVDGCDAILHIAGIVEEDPPQATFEAVNVAGTRHVVTAAEAYGRPALLFMSSLGAERGASEYHRSKLRAEDVVHGYTGAWTVIRPGAVYGPGDDTISTLLTMVRTLPAVPMVAAGDQPFQPLWYADLGEMIVATIGRADLNGRTFEVAGPDLTTTDDILQRLADITGRRVPRLSLPVWVTEVGVQALESFGAMGRRLLRRAGLPPPLDAAKLEMLLEGNVIPDGGHNALSDFVAAPTSLDDGLRMLADLLPEQMPGDGVGRLTRSTYFADIEGAPGTAEQLLDVLCERLHELMPLEFAAEPGAPRAASAGGTLTAAVPPRGNIQVRLEERTPQRASFITLAGHPLAGVMQLHTETLPDGRLRVNVHLAAQPANVVDWLALRTIGTPLQRANWRAVVRRAVAMSGGRAPSGVVHEERDLTAPEASDLRRFAERIVHARQRAAAGA